MRKYIYSSLAAIVLLFLFVSPSSARSGCCSHHGGVCGCGCCDGTALSTTCAPYYPSCGGGYDSTPVYKPIACESTVGNSGTYTFKENNCKQDVQFSWTQGLNDEAFSIGISKVAGADPGPSVDTNSRSWTFSQVSPGTWYINVKPGSNKCGWGRIWHWKVEVPQPTSFFISNIGTHDNDIHLKGKCLKSISSYPSIGKIDNLIDYSTSLSFKKNTKIKFTAFPIYGKAIVNEIEFDPNRIVPTPPPLPTPAPTPKTFSFWNWIFKI